MTINDINKALSQLAEQPARENILDFSFVLLQWMGLEPNANKTPQLLAPKTQKLKDFLVPAPQTVQPQLYRLNTDNQNIRVRFAVLKKLKKEYIGQLVDNDPGAESFQNTPETLRTITKAPYYLHFVATPEYDKLVLIFNQGEQKRIVSFRNRLTNTQYNKIIQQWQGSATKSKSEIADLFWKSLDIKEVNKEFYAKVKERFDALVGIVKREYVNATDTQTKQFTVRMIGRYIFCWFLKEKGIVPYSLISKATISSTDNYYQNTLLKLFFETLNTKVQDRNPLTHEKLFEKIPYLNGGLFDISEEDRLFEKLNLDAWLLPFVEILENYDFTIDESSSQYQQVAVDPEMLGRIFENLLASQNVETEKLANQRKAFGAFYTPREIVDYMVNESIKAQLQTQWESHIQENKTANINNPEPVADIFGNKPVQQLKLETKKYALKPEEKQKIEKALAPLFLPIADAGALKKEEKQLIEGFLKDIKILDPACGSGAFPMGILHKLVELHEVLGTVKTGYELKKDILSQNIYGVDIMPMAIEIARLRAWLSLVLEEDYKPNDPKHNFGVKPLPNLDFKFVCANSLIDLGLDAFINESRGTLREGFTQKLVSQLKGLEELRKQFFQPDLASAEKDGLRKQYLGKRDKVVANIEADSEPVLKQIAEKIKHWNPFDDSTPSSFFSPTWMFGIDKGFDVVIGNPPYIQLSKAENVSDEYKQYLKTRFKTSAGRLNTFVFFIHQSLENLSSSGQLAFIIPNTILTQEYYSYTRGLILKDYQLREIVNYENMPFENAVVENVTLFVQAKKSNGNHKVKITSDDLSSVKIIAEKDHLDFLNQDNFSFSFKSNSLIDKVFTLKNITTVGDLCNVNQAIALKGDKSLSLRNQNPDNKYYKLLDGRNINKFEIKWTGVYLDYSLDKIHSCKRKDIFESKEKLFFRRVSENLVFAYDDQQYFALNTLVAVNLKPQAEFSLKYLLAILNSSLINYLYKSKFKSTKKVFSEIQTNSVEKLPIKKIRKEEQESLISRVEKILSLKKQKQDTTAIEKEIDVLVYKLYDLTYDEVKIVEPDFGMSENEYKEYRSEGMKIKQ